MSGIQSSTDYFGHDSFPQASGHVAYYAETAEVFALNIIARCETYDKDVAMGVNEVDALMSMHHSCNVCMEFLYQFTRYQASDIFRCSVPGGGLLTLQAVYRAVLMWMNRHNQVINREKKEGRQVCFADKLHEDWFVKIQKWPEFYGFESKDKHIPLEV